MITVNLLINIWGKQNVTLEKIASDEPIYRNKIPYNLIKFYTIDKIIDIPN